MIVWTQMYCGINPMQMQTFSTAQISLADAVGMFNPKSMILTLAIYTIWLLMRIVTCPRHVSFVDVLHVNHFVTCYRVFQKTCLCPKTRCCYHSLMPDDNCCCHPLYMQDDNCCSYPLLKPDDNCCCFPW